MNRRLFLAQSALVLPGLAMARSSLAAPLIETARPFTLDVITHRPAEAIRRLDTFMRSQGISETVRFSEQRLRGSLTGDIAFVTERGLLDFRKSGEDAAGHLRDIAGALDLPVQVEDPTLLRFQVAGNAQKASAFNVYRGNTLIERIPISASIASRRFESEFGAIDVSIDKGQARIVGASCRHKTCMQLGAISEAGESLVCIPARLRVATDGQNRWGVDGITG